MGPGVVKWLRRCTTSWTVPGSIPGDVTGFFSDKFSSDCTMALELTQPLVKMSTRNIPGGKGPRCLRLTTSPPSCAKWHEILEPKPPGTLWATPGLLWESFYLYEKRFLLYHTCILHKRMLEHKYVAISIKVVNGWSDRTTIQNSATN
jgi:hypothetical protein